MWLVQGNQSSEKNGNSNGFNYISVVMELGYPDLTHISIYIRQNQTFLVVFLQMQYIHVRLHTNQQQQTIPICHFSIHYIFDKIILTCQLNLGLWYTFLHVFSKNVDIKVSAHDAFLE